MKKIFKAGILIAALVVPASVFIFLKFFGQNHYKLPTYIPQIDSTSGQIMTHKVEDVTGVRYDTVFQTVPDFQLIDQEGKTVTSAITKSKVYVADFIFTRCGSICPKLSTELVRVQDAFVNDPQVLILSHTIDPDYDTPAILKAYAKEYDAMQNKWYFLTGDKHQLYNLAHKGYFIAVQEGEQKADPNETFTHSEKLILIDKNRHIRGFYDGTSKKEVDRLILEIKVLLDIEKTEQPSN